MTDVKEILAQTVFSQIPGNFVYAKLKAAPARPEDHFLVSFDQDEVTVVTELHNFAKLNALERNKEDYALFELKVSVPFYSVGFLAAISSAIATKNINLLIVSTYSKDYVLVRV